MMFPTPEIYYYTACFAFIFSGVICGAVRWFHVCSQYAERSDYFYPARRQATFFYTFLLLFCPYLFHLESADTWLYTRIFGILYYPVCFTMLYRCYFSQKESQYKRLRYNARVAVIPFAFIVAALPFAIMGGDRLAPYRPVILCLAAGAGLLVLYRLVHTMLHLKKRIDDYSGDTYSNTDDFPYKFASRTLPMSVVLAALGWVVFLTDSRMVNMWMNLLFTVWQTCFLIIILHSFQKDDLPDEEEEPVSVRTVEDGGDREESTEDEPEEEMDEETFWMNQEKKLAPRMEKAFMEDRLYLNPNLTIKDLAIAINSNRTYTSTLMNRIHGSFIVYVNHLRIEHSIRLKEENPDIKQGELIQQSGFNNHTSYNKWLASYRKCQNRQFT